jgi:FAD:protein FMN transferase
MNAARLHRETFLAMGTLGAAGVTTGPLDTAHAGSVVAAARAEIAACERALSRFDPASDLSRLNAAGGEWVEVDERLCAALQVALRAREETGGRFDPVIVPALVAAGYDRSFEEIEERPPRSEANWRAGTEIEFDHDGGRARIEEGSAVDLGGIGKGFAAVRALEAMRAAWPTLPGGLVDLGGDIALWGSTPEGGPWRLAIADPRNPGETLGVLELEAGGVATSGRDSRRFGPNRSLHHLIDPATGSPARFGPLAVTVVGPDAVQAEANATALAVTAIADAGVYVEARPDIGAVLVPDEGDSVVLGYLPLIERASLRNVGA